jgi:hypothetical protein
VRLASASLLDNWFRIERINWLRDGSIAPTFKETSVHRLERVIDGVTMSTKNIQLFAGKHAIESEQFTVVFRSPLDSADEGRFEEYKGEIGSFFGSIDEPSFVQLIMGDGPSAKPVMKVLTEFGRNGKATWAGQFGENAVSVTSKQYTNWEEVWPGVLNRLEKLLACVDPFKYVSSIDYCVTDTLEEQRATDQDLHLLSKNIFKRGSWVPDRLLTQYHDPRWDFSAGAFVDSNSTEETLERVEAKSQIAGQKISASITNIFSLRYKEQVRVRDLLEKNGSIGASVVETYSRFHDQNKLTIKSILVEELLTRMGIE